MSALHELFKGYTVLQQNEDSLRLRKVNGQSSIPQQEEMIIIMRKQFEIMCEDVESILKIRLSSPS